LPFPLLNNLPDTLAALALPSRPHFDFLYGNRGCEPPRGFTVLVLRHVSSTVIAQLLICNLYATPTNLLRFLIFPVPDEVSSTLRDFSIVIFSFYQVFSTKKTTINILPACPPNTRTNLGLIHISTQPSMTKNNTPDSQHNC
jgi:hypothetical protein